MENTPANAPDAVKNPVSVPLTVTVVAHTHWDREWYHSAAVFRQRLVALIDSLLAGASGATTPFLLDGQSIILEDYLEVRPEQAVRLIGMLKSGAIEAGPWYVLADGLIPSGEAIVRNLLTGRRVLRRLDAAIGAPQVAYCPDTFGHPAIVPAIAHGFGFPLAIVWRGFGGTGAPPGDTVRWRSDDGATVLLYHLPRDGYETGSALPSDRDSMRMWWSRMRPLLASRSTTGIALLANGADHHALQPDLMQALAQLRTVASSDAGAQATITRASLSEFAGQLVAAASAMTLPMVQGELRNSYGYTWTLGGTYGTRAHQKRTNALVERRLLRDAEPMSTLAWLHARRADFDISANARITMAQMPALINSAWRTLLQAHPHDTLCGCSIDEVAQSMDERLRSAGSQADWITRAATEIALHHDTVAARGRPLSAFPSVVIRNRVARNRGGVAHLILIETIADVAVGPSSARTSRPLIDPMFNSPRMGSSTIQRFADIERHERRESPQHYPDNDLVRAHHVLVWVAPVPSLGLAVRPFDFGPVDAHEQSDRDHKLEAGYDFSPVSDAVVLEKSGDEIRISNGVLSAVISDRGVELTRGDRTVPNALEFETAADAGDSYTPSIRGAARRLSVREVHVSAVGPLRAGAIIKYSDRDPESGTSVDVSAIVQLDAGSDTLLVEILGINGRANHRLRVVFNTDVRCTGDAPEGDVNVWADAAFGPVQRNPLKIPAEAQLRETVPATVPMHRWISMCNEQMGATLHGDGLAEVEANRETGAVSLTLLRAIGELSRNDLPERPGHAGWPARIPLAQSQGPFTASIALQLHGAWNQDTRDAIEYASDDFLLPLSGTTMRDLERPAADLAGPRLEGTALRFSTAALADNEDGIVLRCFNDSFEPQNGRWILPDVASLEYTESRLDETVSADWKPCGTKIAFIAPSRAIVTFRVRRRAT